MPELPEVETVVRRLTEVLPGKTIIELSVLRDKSFQGNPSFLLDQQIKSISRRAKIICLHLTNEKIVLIYLKMTGQLIYHSKDKKIGGGHPSADWVNQLPSSHTRIIAHLNDGDKLFFNDMRVFGWWKIIDPKDLEFEFRNYGPDVNTVDFSLEYLTEKLVKKSMPIKQVIMDNSTVAGIGNIYASEALYLAGIDPRRSAKSLDKKEIKDLYNFAKQVIDAGIIAGGTTFDGKYVDIFGMAGQYQNQLNVYGQDGKSCLKCGALINKVKLGGRGSFFCPNCQK